MNTQTFRLLDGYCLKSSICGAGLVRRSRLGLIEIGEDVNVGPFLDPSRCLLPVWKPV